jgi:integrase/recombinase XerD
MGGRPPNDRRTVGDMTTSQVLPSRLPESHALQLAVAGYLTRFKGISRTHAESDLRAYLGWCANRDLDPLAAARPHVELYVRWMQEVRRLKPSTVSQRTSIVAGFYPTAVIDGRLEHSPAEHVRRPHVPADSPTLGLTHLQLEALLTAARQSPNRCDFASSVYWPARAADLRSHRPARGRETPGRRSQ